MHVARASPRPCAAQGASPDIAGATSAAGSFALFRPLSGYFQNSDKQTYQGPVGMSQRCHQRTHAPQQIVSLFDHLISKLLWVHRGSQSYFNSYELDASSAYIAHRAYCTGLLPDKITKLEDHLSAQPLGTPEGSAIDELSAVEPTMSENMTVTCRRLVMSCGPRSISQGRIYQSRVCWKSG